MYQGGGDTFDTALPSRCDLGWTGESGTHFPDRLSIQDKGTHTFQTTFPSGCDLGWTSKGGTPSRPLFPPNVSWDVLGKGHTASTQPCPSTCELEAQGNARSVGQAGGAQHWERAKGRNTAGAGLPPLPEGAGYPSAPGGGRSLSIAGG